MAKGKKVKPLKAREAVQRATGQGPWATPRSFYDVDKWLNRTQPTPHARAVEAFSQMTSQERTSFLLWCAQSLNEQQRGVADWVKLLQSYGLRPDGAYNKE